MSKQAIIWTACLLLAPGTVLSRADGPAATGTTGTTGTLEGTVRFTGTVPPAQKIALTDGTTLVHNDLLVEPKTRGLRFVVAVLEDAPPQPRLDRAQPAVIDQRDMVFLPRVVAVQHGRTVRFENNDLGNHSVMASSLVAADQFNRVASPGMPIEHTFTAQRAPVQIGCSLHGWMRAWVYVLPHPWFAVSDEKGQWRIANIPPGKYRLWLRHADGGLQERREVEIAAGQTTRVESEWKEAAGK